jgi:hypothetical protein
MRHGGSCLTGFVALLALVALAGLLSASCGPSQHRPNLPPPEYEEPAPPTPAPSSTGSAAPAPAPSR